MADILQTTISKALSWSKISDNGLPLNHATSHYQTRWWLWLPTHTYAPHGVEGIPTVFLVTTNRMLQWFNVLADVYNVFLILIFCCILLEIKLTISCVRGRGTSGERYPPACLTPAQRNSCVSVRYGVGIPGIPWGGRTGVLRPSRYDQSILDRKLLTSVENTFRIFNNHLSFNMAMHHSRVPASLSNV